MKNDIKSNFASVFNSTYFCKEKQRKDKELSSNTLPESMVVNFQNTKGKILKVTRIS